MSTSGEYGSPYVLYAVAAFLALLAAAGAWLLWVDFDLDALVEWIKSVGMWSVPALILLMIAHNFIPVPAEVIVLCAGAIFGTAGGAFVGWAGAMLGAALAFWLSRRFGRVLVERHVAPRHLVKIDTLIESQGTVGLFCARLTPLIAFNLVNYGAGLTTVSWATFLWTTAIGILPITVLTAYAGANMRDLSLQTILILSVVAVLGFVLTIWARRQRR